MYNRRFFQTRLGKSALVSIVAMSAFVVITLPMQIIPNQNAAPAPAPSPAHALPGQMVLATVELA